MGDDLITECIGQIGNLPPCSTPTALNRARQQADRLCTQTGWRPTAYNG